MILSIGLTFFHFLSKNHPEKAKAVKSTRPAQQQPWLARQRPRQHRGTYQSTKARCDKYVPSPLKLLPPRLTSATRAAAASHGTTARRRSKLGLSIFCRFFFQDSQQRRALTLQSLQGYSRSEFINNRPLIGLRRKCAELNIFDRLYM